MTTVYLIPSVLSTEGFSAVHPYTLNELQNCKVIFAEQLRTVRRFLKGMDSSIDIDTFEWHEIQYADAEITSHFKKQ